MSPKQQTSSQNNWSASSEQQFLFHKFKLQDSSSNFIDYDGFKNFLADTFGGDSHKNTSFQANLTPSGANDIRDRGRKNLQQFSEDQIGEMFKVFDQNQDGVIDFDEFTYLCENWLEKLFRRGSSALIVVDVQNDFIDGSLALINGPAGQDGVEVVEVINKILDENNFDLVVYTQDWHPPDHIGFHENLHLRKYKLPESCAKITDQEDTIACDNVKNDKIDSSRNGDGDDVSLTTQDNCSKKFKLKRLVKDVQLFETVLFEDGKMEQKLWPTHCVQNSWGAELHPKLRIIPGALRILKGTISNVDAYSAFWDNKHLNETGLKQALVSRNIEDVYVCGLALDFCVSATALDSARSGFMTFVIEDACRGIDPNEIDRAKRELTTNNIILIDCRDIKESLLSSRRVNLSYRKAMLLSKCIKDHVCT